MVSRYLLRAFLAAAAVPFVLLASTGCDVVFTLDEVVLEDNALRCACSCDGAGQQRDLAVEASSDDAEQTGALMELPGPDLDLGERIVGLRFANPGIPRGAQITSAVVQFVSSEALGGSATVSIVAELSNIASTFTVNDNDISSRTEGAASVTWPIPDWAGNNASGAAQQTPDIKDLIQELVDQTSWTTSSAIVLRFEGSGHRAARSFDGNRLLAPVLLVTYDGTVAATIPVCASTAVTRDGEKRITPQGLLDECTRVQATFTGLASQCGYPVPCQCDPVDAPDQDDSFYSEVCGECVEEEANEACTNFDPNRFADCVAETLDVAGCKQLVSATNAPGDSPVCVPSGSALAFQAFGRRSLCELSGTSEIHVGDREPQKDPATDGTVEVLGGPCIGGGCDVVPFFDLRMDNITFSVRFHEDPTFKDLSASGRSLDPAFVDGLEATFGDEALRGTGNGRRGSEGLGLSGNNASPLKLGLNWAEHKCDMNGNLVADVDSETPDGACEGDDTVVCIQDSPDCDEVGGPCNIPDDTVTSENMTIDVHLNTGTLVNQPPLANAGPDQTDIECTSPDGADVVLDGRSSSDPNGDLTLASWLQGSRVGDELSKDLRTVQTIGVGDSSTYVLRVIDSYAQSDEDETEANVVDTTKPVIACNNPATIRPPSKPVSFTATATDTCDADVPTTVISYDCFKITGTGKRNSQLGSCKVTLAGGTLTIRSKGGIGDHVQWTVRAVDDSGNTQDTPCEVVLAN